MKYNPPTGIIPQDRREKLNQTILALIDTGTAEAQGITNQDIYQAYTGIGGLSGVKRRDYGSFYDFSEAKKDIENGQFFTPHALAATLIECLRPSSHDLIADLTCGCGVFINHAPSEYNFYGCELDGNAFKVAKYLYPEAQLFRGDIRTYEPGVAADIVIGNPPFNLKWQVRGEDYRSQFYYCLKAHEILRPGGLLALITPLSFLEDEHYNSTDIKHINHLFSFLCASQLPKDAFRMLGVSDFETQMLFFQKRSGNIEHTPYDHTFFVPLDSGAIFRNYIEPAKKAAEAVRHKLRAELAEQRAGQEHFYYKVDKLLYDIGRHPATKGKLGKCRAQLDKFLTQRQPVDMTYEVWQKKRLTEAKLLAYLRQTLQSQHPKRKDPPQNNYEGWERRKGYEVEWQSIPFDDLPPDPAIDEFLRCIVYTSKKTGKEKRLNEKQLLDTNRILQKRYGFVQWEQGAGKTLHGIANAAYRILFNRVKQVFIVSTAISIKNNWADVMPDFGVPMVMINKLRDINRLQDRRIAIITIDMAVKYRKQLRRYVRMKNRNVALIFDESDAITCVDSKRTKAMLEIFRRAHYKTLMTGTMTRNNICEAWSQLELLYNNSDNMLCESTYLYEVKNGPDGSYHSSYYNSDCGNPFPPYKKGYALFSAAHLPERITVFGAGQMTQDVYNAGDLRKLLAKTVITRTFKEITGRDIRGIKQNNVEFAPEDRKVYRLAVKEFERMRWEYFNSTGSSRKDAGLKLAQQIKLMLRITAAPDSVKEYEGGIPAKQQAMIELIKSWENERVAIGVRHYTTLDSMARAVRSEMPGRPVIEMTGNKMSLKRRKTAIAELAKTTNGILICTQQSLSSSMNIDEFDKACIPELHWNNVGMSQWYMRFVRFDSERDKEIHFFTYAGSIESNLLHMVINKEKLNLFMKEQMPEDTELFAEFGVDYDLFGMLMTCEIDDDGKFKIRWGDQEIVS
jgi:trans-aconitate methyltransferase